jgi:hypothetical protein
MYTNLFFSLISQRAFYIVASKSILKQEPKVVFEAQICGVRTKYQLLKIPAIIVLRRPHEPSSSSFMIHQLLKISRRLLCSVAPRAVSRAGSCRWSRPPNEWWAPRTVWCNQSTWGSGDVSRHPWRQVGRYWRWQGQSTSPYGAEVFVEATRRRMTRYLSTSLTPRLRKH